MKPIKAPQQLWQAYFALLKTHTADQIGVQQLCTVAGLNRTTFYKYFANLFELIEYGFTQVAQQTMMPADEARVDLLSAEKVVAFFAEHRTELRHLQGTPYLYRMQQSMAVAVEKHLLAVFARYPEAYRSEIPQQVMAQFYIGGMMKLLFAWLHQADCQADELTGRLNILAHKLMADCMPKTI